MKKSCLITNAPVNESERSADSFTGAGDKRLIGIDVHWDTPGEEQGLLLTKDRFYRLTMTETNLELENTSTNTE